MNNLCEIRVVPESHGQYPCTEEESLYGRGTPVLRRYLYAGKGCFYDQDVAALVQEAGLQIVSNTPVRIL